ncbi:3-oxoacid CoA-transferase subunit B [Oscillospiraceae bacterium LTW-04]|nr:3-oxoacid CoA-transferase subunit B [Oscillospiraceae bacterium MB24-C1]
MADLKARIAARTAKEFKDGDVINLGIGLPTLVANYIPEDVNIILHSENGFVGLSSSAEPGKENVDVINSGGSYVTYVPEVNFFDTAMSFSIVRGGHLDATVLGAMEVDEHGNLANWIVPGKIVAGMGGAMDLVVGAKKVIISMLHTQKGAHKILKKCTLPYTALGVVKLIITEMGVIEVTPKGLLLTELHPDYTLDEIRAATGCELKISPDLKIMEEA